MRKVTFLVVLILFISTLFISCNREVIIDWLWPMKVGNTWTYETYDEYLKFDSFNREPFTLTSDTTLYVEKIEAYNEIQGHTGYTNYKLDEIPFLFNFDKEGNIIRIVFYENEFVCESIQYKKNAKKGDSWTIKLGDSIETQCSCIVSDTIISTPIGNFHCIGYVYRFPVPGSIGYSYLEYEEYFSMGVGCIKTVVRRGQTHKSEYTLINYSLK